MESLIQRCKARNREAQEELYENYKNQVYRTALLFTCNRTLADDITQETFIRLFDKINLYDESYPFQTWLYKVVLNVARNTLRKHKWETILNPFAEEYEKEDFNTPVYKFEKKEQQEILHSIVDCLPYKYQEVIILKYYNSFSQEEISNILQIPIGTVKSRINTALEKIRKKIKNTSSIKEVFNYE